MRCFATSIAGQRRDNEDEYQKDEDQRYAGGNACQSDISGLMSIEREQREPYPAEDNSKADERVAKIAKAE